MAPPAILLRPLALPAGAWWPPAAIVAGVLVALWLTLWALSRWLRRWRAAHQIMRVLRRTLEVFAAVIVGLIALRTWMPGRAQLSGQRVTDWVLGPGLHILFIFVLAFVLVRITDFFIGHLQGMLAAPETAPHDAVERQKRIATLGRLLRALATIAILGMAGLMALREVNIDITPVLTGAGVAGVALGFGAQTLVKDLIAGVFLILENQIRIGDVITINGKTGKVESIRLRILTLRGGDGSLYVFQNGSITEYINLTKDFACAVLDLTIAWKENPAQVRAILAEIGRALATDPGFRDKLLAAPEVLAVESLGAASFGVKLQVKTAAGEQWAVLRELRRRVKERFQHDQIALA
ncbi:MAG: mechanosensitive ion channel domain-containing protein [Terriglobales bacterium]